MIARLLCPMCGRAGTAHVQEAAPRPWSAEAGWMDVLSLPAGFDAVARPSLLHESLDIECTHDRVSALTPEG